MYLFHFLHICAHMPSFLTLFEHTYIECNPPSSLRGFEYLAARYLSTPFHQPLSIFTIVFPVKSEEAFFLKQCVLASSFPDLLDVLPCSSRNAYSVQGLPGYEAMFARCFTARKPQNDQFICSGHSVPHAPCGPDGLFHETFLPAPFRSREIVSHLNYYAVLLRRYSSCSLSGRFCHLFLLANTLI